MKEFAALAPFAMLLVFLTASLATGAQGQSQSRRIAVLRDDFAYASPSFVEQLAESLRTQRGAKMVRGEDLPELLANKPAAIDVLVLPDARFFPINAKEQLNVFLEQGGDLLAVGGPAFSKLMVKMDGQWLDREGAGTRLPALTKRVTLTTIDDDAAGKWKADDEESTIKLSVEDSGLAEIGKCLRVDVTATKGAELVASDNLRDRFGAAHITSFWAKGDSETKDLAVIWEEADSSRWYAVIELGSEWRQYAIPSYAFKYERRRHSSKDRGHIDDQFKPANAAKLFFGYKDELTKAAKGARSFCVAGVEAAWDDVGELNYESPLLETLSPQYKVFEVSEAVRLEPHPGQAIITEGFDKRAPGKMVCPIWRSRGLGSQKETPYRWIPILTAEDASGELRGVPVSLFLNLDNAFKGSIWGLIGMADADFLTKRSPYVIGLVETLLAKMDERVFLKSAGLDKFCYLTGEKGV